MRAGLRLSYRDLPPDTARMFRLLGSLNVTEFSAWAGAALLDVDPVDAEDLIEQLVDAQLLEPLRASAGHVRYRFQDLLRLFARECALAEDGEGELKAALRRACAVWLGLAKEAHRRVYGGDYTVVPGSAPHRELPSHLVESLVENPMEWFEAERSSITGLVQQAARGDESGYAWDLAMTSVTLFQNRNYLEDWRECGEAALAATRRTGDRLGEAAMLQSLGTLEIIQYEHDTAYERLGLALRLFEEQGQDQGRALVLRNLAMCERHRGDTDRAVETGRRSLEIFRAVGDPYAEAHVLGLLAQIELERGDAQASLMLSSEAVARSRGLGTVRGEAQSTLRLAQALIHQGDGVRAEEAGFYVRWSWCSAAVTAVARRTCCVRWGRRCGARGSSRRPSRSHAVPCRPRSRWRTSISGRGRPWSSEVCRRCARTGAAPRVRSRVRRTSSPRSGHRIGGSGWSSSWWCSRKANRPTCMRCSRSSPDGGPLGDPVHTHGSSVVPTVAEAFHGSSVLATVAEAFHGSSRSRPSARTDHGSSAVGPAADAMSPNGVTPCCTATPPTAVRSKAAVAISLPTGAVVAV